ncbi:MAG: beta-lactamase family protein [Proteobacteria bacterium]|nr:beta-lactamase family protein [Pseudomonadota bacterium]
MIRRLAALLLILAAAPVHAGVAASVAVAFDRNQARVVLAEGEADRASHRLVTADDPVRIASVSKLVTALGVLRLVDAGKLNLDRDVSDYLGWPLRHPGFPDRPITLRLLLSHQSGLLDGEDRYIIPLGTTLRQRLAEPALWDMAHAPGSGWFHYTNLNFPVVASVMEAASGERFDRLMARLVLRPLRLDACYNWSGCAPGTAARAVVLYRASGEVAKDDLKGVIPPCPVVTGVGAPCDLGTYRPGDNGALFSPQGGLRISMRDLARIGQLLARRGRGFLSRRAFAELTRPAWRYDGRNGLGEGGGNDGMICAYGLALQIIGGAPGPACHDALFADGRRRIGHPGSAYGLRSGLWLDPASGRGLAFFTTAVPDDAPAGRSAFSQPEEALVERATR